MSKVKVIRLKEELPDDEMDKLEGQYLTESYYDTLVSGYSADILRPDGKPLIKFRSQIFDYDVCYEAWKALRKVSFGSANRGSAGGIVEGVEDGQELFKGPKKEGRGSRGLLKGNVRMRPLKKDGTLSNTEYAVQYAAGNTLPSAIVGFYDRYARIPYCRKTAFNLEYPQRFRKAMPYIQKVDSVFASEMPERYAAQMEQVKKTSKDFVIHSTAFTTITVNKSWQTAVHKDDGDLPEGFGVMCAFWASKEEKEDPFRLRMGESFGNYLVFPKFRVAVDMTAGDVLLADVHQWHGNTEYLGMRGFDERISLVLYYRKQMILCGSAAQEEERAKQRIDPETCRPRGLPLYDKEEPK